MPRVRLTLLYISAVTLNEVKGLVSGKARFFASLRMTTKGKKFITN